MKECSTRLTLVLFERYHGGAPAIPRLYFRAVLPMLRKEPGLRALSKPGTGYTYLGFNLRSGPLADVRVRRALCHLLEVRPLVENKLEGLAVP